MKIALLSDIHGHFDALERAWNSARKLADAIVCLGDIVDGGGADDDCAAFVRLHRILCVGGNHDQSCVLLGEPRLKPENKRFLSELPRTLTVGGLVLVHDSPLSLDDPEPSSREDRARRPWRHWRYILTAETARDTLAKASLFRRDPSAIVATGHTHRPAVFAPEGELTLPFVQGRPLKLDFSRPHLLNPGSVGSPRFPLHGATFGLFDAARREFSVHPVPPR